MLNNPTPQEIIDNTPELSYPQDLMLSFANDEEEYYASLAESQTYEEHDYPNPSHPRVGDASEDLDDLPF